MNAARTSLSRLARSAIPKGERLMRQSTPSDAKKATSST